jgi:hypothetical protein
MAKKIKQYLIWSFLPLMVGVFLTALFFIMPQAKAEGTRIIEQHINLIEAPFSNNTQTVLPTDNSLGIFHYDASKYPGATIYFEVIAKTTEGTCCSDAGLVSLYTTSGTEVANVSIWWNNIDYTLYRSSAVTLVDGQDYTIRLRTTRNNVTSTVKLARLVIVQSDANKIAATANQISLGSLQTITSGSYIYPENQKLFFYDSSKFNPDPTVYLDFSLRGSQPTIEQQVELINSEYTTSFNTSYPTDNSLGRFKYEASKYTGETIYFEALAKIAGWGCCSGSRGQVYLYDTLGNQVAQLNVSWDTNNYARLRSGPLTLVDGREYTIRTYLEAKDILTLKSARLIFQQTDGAKITDTTTTIPIGTDEFVTSSTYTYPSSQKIFQYDASKYSPTPSIYLETLFKGSQPTIEQQINIVNQLYTTTSNNYSPTDNSLGIFHYDASKYGTNPKIYFEADLGRTGYGWEKPYIALYDTAGNQVANSELTGYSYQEYYTIFRSEALTLTDNTDYTIRIHSQVNGIEAGVKSARLIINQSDTSKITQTQTQIESGNNETTTQTSYAPLANKKIYRFDSSKFTPVPTVYFEASLANDTGGETAYAALYENGSSCTNLVAGSEVTVVGTSWARTRSGAVTLTTGTDYMVCVKTSAGAAKIANAKVILDQSEAAGITALELVHNQVNTLATDGDVNYSKQFFANRINPDFNSTGTSFAGGTFNYFYEATMKTSAGTAYSRMSYAPFGNSEALLAVDGGEISTSETNYTRVRSGDITAGINAFKNYISYFWLDTDLKNSGNNTTSIASSNLIIQVSNLSTTATSAYVELYNVTDGASVANSELTTSNTTYQRLRSPALSLVSGKDYAIRVKSGNNNSQVRLADARLLLEQSSSGGVTALQTYQRQLGNNSTDSDATYTSQRNFNAYNNDLVSPASFTGCQTAFYYEATARTTGGTGYARLYDTTTGSAISSGELTTTSANFSRLRSVDLSSYLPQYPTYTSNQEMDTQLKNSESYTTTVANSWLVVDVSNLVTSAVSGYAELYNVTDGTSVPGSEVSSSSITWSRARSGSFTLTSGKEYSVRVKSSQDNVGVRLATARIIVDQADVNGIGATEMYQMLITSPATTVANTLTDLLSSVTYTPANYSGGSFNYFYEVDMSAGSGTATTDLYNQSDSSVITGSQLTASSNQVTRVRSGNLTANMPVANKNLSVRASNSTGATTRINSAALVIQAAGMSILPSNPSSMSQYKSDGTTQIATGGTTTETTVILSSTVSDADPSDILMAEFELLPVGSNFTNVANYTSAPISYSGTPLPATVTISSLTDQTNFHWQARTCDDAGNCSAWLSFGNNNENETDFTVSINQSPNVPNSLSYVGGYISNNQPTFSFVLSDPDANEQVAYRIQVDDTAGLSSPVLDYTSATAAEGLRSFVVGQATSGGTYNGVGSLNQYLADGSYYWQVKSIDDSGAESIYIAANSGNVAFTVDTTPPSVPDAPTTTTPTANTTPTWTWSSSTDSSSGLHASPYLVQWCSNTSFTGCDENVGTSTTTSFTQQTSLSDGSWYFRVRVRDAVNNLSNYSAYGTVEIDVAGPSTPGQPSTTSPTTDTTPAWTWDASLDDQSGLPINSYVVQWCLQSNFVDCDSNVDTSTTNSYTHNSALANGIWNFRVKGLDDLNNESAYSMSGSVQIDNSPPTNPGVPNTSTPTNNIRPTWAWTEASDSGVGLAVDPYTVQWCEQSNFVGCDGNVATSDDPGYTHLAPLDDGTWYFRVKAKDVLNNETSYTSAGSVLVDTSIPDQPGTPTTETPTTDTTPTWTWTAPADTGTGVDHYVFQWCDNLAFENCSGNLATIGGVTFTHATNLPQGNWHVRVRAVDVVGNLSTYSGTGSVLVDTTAPAAPGTPSTTTPTIDTTPTWTWTAPTDSGSGLAAVPYTVQWCSNNTFTGCDLNTATTAATNYTHTAVLAETTWYFRVKAKDNLNNESDYSNLGTVLISTTPPTAPDLSAGPGDNIYTNNPRLTFKWYSQSHNDVVSYNLNINNGDSNSFSLDGLAASGSNQSLAKYNLEYLNFSDSDNSNNIISLTTKDHSDWGNDTNRGALKEGNREWKVTAVNGANITAQSSRHIFVDLTGPTLASLSINGVSAADGLTTTATKPTITGRISDRLAGDKAGNYVAAGPNQVTINFAKKQWDGSFTNISNANVAINTMFWGDTGQVVGDANSNRADKYADFSWQIPDALAVGDYRVTITGRDRADNSSSNSYLIKVVASLQPSPLPSVSPSPLVSPLPSPTPIEQVSQQPVEPSPEISLPSPTPQLADTTLVPVASNPPSGIVNEVVNNMSEVVVDTVQNAIQSATEGIQDVANNIIDISSQAVTKIGEVLGAMTPDNLSNLTDNIAAPFSPMFDQLAMKIGSTRDIWLDNEPTNIYDLKVSDIGDNYATITWKTNHYATSKVSYGQSLDYGKTAYSDKKTKDHRLTLTGLSPENKYYYEAMSQGKNYAYDAWHTFDTSNNGRTWAKEDAKRFSNPVVQKVYETSVTVAETTSQVVETTAPVSAAAATVAVPTVSILLLLSQLGENFSFQLILKLLQALGLLPKKAPQGMVFNSLTHEPVAFALLTIRNHGEQHREKIQETVVTDVHGVYQGISLAPGDYTLTVSHQDFKFPSEQPRPKLVGFQDFHRGELFKVKSQAENQLFLIPVDPLKKEKTKPRLADRIKYLLAGFNLTRLTGPLFIFSLIVEILYPSWLNVGIVVFYLSIFAKNWWINHSLPHLVGKVLEEHGKPVANAIIRIGTAESNQLVSLITSNEQGIFNLPLKKNLYQIMITKFGYLWQKPNQGMSFEQLDLKEKSKKINIHLVKADQVYSELFGKN